MSFITKNITKLLTLSSLLLAVAASSVHAKDIYEVTEVADGVYYHQGVHEDANKFNLGAIANVGFIIGKDCIAVVDSGGSYAEGVELHDAIRKVSDLPICYVINTHVHPDHILGNSAFKNTKATYAGSAKLPAALEARKDFYETNFREILGEAYGDAEFIAPAKLVEVGESVSIDLGERPLTLIAYPTAHTDNDLVVIDNNTKTLWTGDLLFVQRIPALDGSINGWIRVMDELAKLEFNTVIPGHGPVLKGEWKSALALQKQYFTHVREQVREIIFDMGTITQATTEVGLGENKDWLLHEEYHKRNVTSSFTELEWE